MQVLTQDVGVKVLNDSMTLKYMFPFRCSYNRGNKKLNLIKKNIAFMADWLPSSLNY
jgi:hypothetical protein